MYPCWLIEFAESLEVVQKREDFLTALKSLTLSQGFERFAYIDTVGTNVRGVSDYARPWQAHYLDRQFSIIDPVVKTGQTLCRPFQWSQENMPTRLTKPQKEFMDEAAEFGIRSGFTIPIPTGFRHTALLTFASSSSQPDSPILADPTSARDAAMYLHAYARHRGRQFLDAPDYRLTPKECKVLAWIKRGYSVEDTAEIMGLKVPGVRFHVRGARRKLGAFSLQQAIGIATENGLI